MSASTQFIETIKTFLENKASTDELFAVTYAKPNKSVEECCNYITKCAQEGKAQGYSDSEVYGWAIHYYDEDDIKDIKPIKAQVVVNHQVALTEKEKEEIKKQAIAKAIEESATEHKKELMNNIELSPEEIAHVKEKAINKVFEEQKEKMLQKKTAKALPKVSAPALGLIVPEETNSTEGSKAKSVEIVIPDEPIISTNGQSSLF